MDNKLDINVTEKIVSDENMLKTVEEALIRQNAKINQELLEIQKTLDEIEKQGDM